MKKLLLLGVLVAALIEGCREPLPVVVPTDGCCDTVWITLIHKTDNNERMRYASFKGFLIARYPSGIMMGVCEDAECRTQLTNAREQRGWYIRKKDIENDPTIDEDILVKWNPQTDIIPAAAPDSLTFMLCANHTLEFSWNNKGGRTDTVINKFGMSPVNMSRDEVLAAMPQGTATDAEYEFDGWYKGDFNNKYDTSTIALPAKLYARWIKTHLITFNTMGGTDISSVRVRDNERIPRPNKPTHTSNQEMLFWGWYTDQNYEDLWLFQRIINSPITLFARWYNKFGNDDNVDASTKILKHDLPGYYFWTKDGEDSDNHYNPCPDGWEVPTKETMRTILQHASNITWQVLPNTWTSTYKDGQAQHPYVHRAFTGNDSLPVVQLAPVRCVQYLP